MEGPGVSCGMHPNVMKIQSSISHISLLLALGMMAAGWTAAAQSTNQLHFPLAGFSIAALEEPPGTSPQQALMMFLPATDSFAANVNVQIQPYSGSMEDYIALTLDQVKKA